MTDRQPTNDQPCVLPADPAWFQEAGWVENVLGHVAAAYAAVAHADEADRYILPPLTYRIAADTLSSIRDQIPDTPPRAGVHILLLVVKGHELDALWDVLTVLRRARDRDADTEELFSLVGDYVGECYLPPHTVEDVINELEHILALLTLDIPAVRSVATALLLKQDRDEEFRRAYEQLSDVWQSVGVSCY
ncbi:hypothetical protein ABZV75_39990 [Streptomyces flaveolus]|uniref:hypothetical protein n=1 Tax=Streptomyces flaveolus TaxID=67297 RepID=UPI0033BF074F